MNRIPVYSIILVILAFGLGWPTIIHIPGDYPTIQQGIDASTDGDTVLVQPGMYVGNGNRDLDMLGKAIHIKSVDGPDYTVISCQGSMGNAHRGFYLHGNEDSTSIIDGFTITGGFAYSTGAGIYCENASPKIIDCKFMNNESDNYGGGMYVAAGNTLVLEGCSFTENQAFGGGGALYIDSTSITMSDCLIASNISNVGSAGINFYFARGSIIECIIRDNTGLIGGGIGCIGSDSIFFEDCLFEHNDVTEWSGYGGGVYINRSSPNFINCSFIENTATTGGALLSEFYSEISLVNCQVLSNYTWSGSGGAGLAIFYGTSLTLTGCVVEGNLSSGAMGGGIRSSRSNSHIINTVISSNHAGSGGGIFAAYESGVEIINSTIAENGASARGGGICAEDTATIHVSNCIIWGNHVGTNPDAIYQDTLSSVHANYSDIQEGWQGIGNIDSEPMFRDPTAGNFYLMSTACGGLSNSPCIDAGDPNILDSLLDCSWGLGMIRSDMGAYGGGDSISVGILDNLPPLPDRFMLLQNYPNPFNSATTIQYQLPEPGRVRIDIYDLLGRRVETLIDEDMQAGRHQVVWDAADHSSGVYFYRIESGDFTETKKMILLK